MFSRIKILNTLFQRVFRQLVNTQNYQTKNVLIRNFWKLHGEFGLQYGFEKNLFLPHTSHPLSLRRLQMCGVRRSLLKLSVGQNKHRFDENVEGGWGHYHKIHISFFAGSQYTCRFLPQYSQLISPWPSTYNCSNKL